MRQGNWLFVIVIGIGLIIGLYLMVFNNELFTQLVGGM